MLDCSLSYEQGSQSQRNGDRRSLRSSGYTGQLRSCIIGYSSSSSNLKEVAVVDTG